MRSATASSSDASVSNRTVRVLVVDDSPIDQRLAGNLLKNQIDSTVDFADNGLSAITYLQQTQPDILLTDMRMPEMDGLQLVEAVRERFPLVPVILMTAFGSEEIATQALQRGAASYVPKRSLSQKLAETVTDVLALSSKVREQRRLKECWTETRFEFCIENDTSLITPLVSHLQDYLARMRSCDETEIVRVGVALHEAIRNAIHHGNLELDSALRELDGDEYYDLGELRRRTDPYRSRRVSLVATESPNEARYVIRDEGPGFDFAILHHDPTDHAHLARPSGRGLFLIRTFMDEVQFNDRGNEITMIHRRGPTARLRE